MNFEAFRVPSTVFHWFPMVEPRPFWGQERDARTTTPLSALRDFRAELAEHQAALLRQLDAKLDELGRLGLAVGSAAWVLRRDEQHMESENSTVPEGVDEQKKLSLLSIPASAALKMSIQHLRKVKNLYENILIIVIIYLGLLRII